MAKKTRQAGIKEDRDTEGYRPRDGMRVRE